MKNGWHLGNGDKGHTGRGLRKWEEGIKGSQYWIHHGTGEEGWEKNSGFNTHKQFKMFYEKANIGDVLFMHCSSLPSGSAITHYGTWTGEIIPYGKGESLIIVEEWIPFETYKSGSGKNATLYEVKEGDKNYENYRI